MVVTQLGLNAPNGDVGVHGWMRNAESSRFTAGIIRGFVPRLEAMTVIPGGSTAPNYAQCTDTVGNMIVAGSNVVDNTAVELSAPTTSGQSVVWAIVLSVDSTASTSVNDGVGNVLLTAVQGTPATTGSETIPTDATIRGAIDNGAGAFVCVLMTVTLPYGTNTLTTDMVNKTRQGAVPINDNLRVGRVPYESNLRNLGDYDVFAAQALNNSNNVYLDTETYLKYIVKGDSTFVPTLTSTANHGDEISGITGLYLVSLYISVQASNPWGALYINGDGITPLGQPVAPVIVEAPVNSAIYAISTPVLFNDRSARMWMHLETPSGGQLIQGDIPFTLVKL